MQPETNRKSSVPSVTGEGIAISFSQVPTSPPSAATVKALDSYSLDYQHSEPLDDFETNFVASLGLVDFDENR